jgi:hypothetical protein
VLQFARVNLGNVVALVVLPGAVLVNQVVTFLGQKDSFQNLAVACHVAPALNQLCFQ